MFRNLIALSALLLLLPFTQSVSAQVTYSYTGPTFYFASGAPYSTANSITGSFTTAAPLAANLSDSNISANITAFSFTDGVATRTLANTVICRFLVSTDASGAISGHSIWLRQSNTTAMQNQHSLELYEPFKGTSDLAGLGALGETTCAPGPLNPFASSNAGTGAWVASVAGGPQIPVPVNAGWALLALAGVFGLVGIRRLTA